MKLYASAKSTYIENIILTSVYRRKHAGKDAFSSLQNVLFKQVVDADPAKTTK
jgi:hypothetical protein